MAKIRSPGISKQPNREAQVLRELGVILNFPSYNGDHLMCFVPPSIRPDTTSSSLVMTHVRRATNGTDVVNNAHHHHSTCRAESQSHYLDSVPCIAVIRRDPSQRARVYRCVHEHKNTCDRHSNQHNGTGRLRQPLVSYKQLRVRPPGRVSS